MTFILHQDQNGDGVIGIEEVCGCVPSSVFSKLICRSQFEPLWVYLTV